MKIRFSSLYVHLARSGKTGADFQQLLGRSIVLWVLVSGSTDIWHCWEHIRTNCRQRCGMVEKMAINFIFRLTFSFCFSCFRNFPTISCCFSFPVAPETVKIRVEPDELKHGVEATLICDSSSSNPPSKVSWWKDGIPVEGNLFSANFH